LDISGNSAGVGSVQNPAKRDQTVSVAIGAPPRHGVTMNINLSLAPIVALIAGILILVMPKLLNYIIALYLIFIGLIGLFGTGNFHFR
jgi:hypothetical protein